MLLNMLLLNHRLDILADFYGAGNLCHPDLSRSATNYGRLRLLGALHGPIISILSILVWLFLLIKKFAIILVLGRRGSSVNACTLLLRSLVFRKHDISLTCSRLRRLEHCFFNLTCTDLHYRLGALGSWCFVHHEVTLDLRAHHELFSLGFVKLGCYSCILVNQEILLLIMNRLVALDLLTRQLSNWFTVNIWLDHNTLDWALLLARAQLVWWLLLKNRCVLRL